MFTDRFLRNKHAVTLDGAERSRLERAVSEIRHLEPRTLFVKAGRRLDHSTLLLDGIMSRYIDDRRGLRQLVAVHFPGDFVDLHAFPLKKLDHDVGTMTAATVAIVPHAEIDDIMINMPQFARKLWFATLTDAAIHRAWVFRLGRLDAVGRVAHFLCETNARLYAAGLSDGKRFTLSLTQADLADICGLTNIHVNRVMRQLREERLCVFRSSIVEIPDPEQLAARGQFKPDYLYLEADVTETRRAPLQMVQ